MGCCFSREATLPKATRPKTLYDDYLNAIRSGMDLNRFFKAEIKELSEAYEYQIAAQKRRRCIGIILLGILDLDEKNIQSTQYTEQELAMVQLVESWKKINPTLWQESVEKRDRLISQVSKDEIVKWVKDSRERDEKDAQFLPRIIEQYKRPDITIAEIQLISQEVQEFSARPVEGIPEFMTKLVQSCAI